jgi:hypothetical protein
MDKQGSFGYKIGRKIRLMNVEHDAYLLWRILVREIYVLIKHYGSIELLRKNFENLNEANGKPTGKIIEKLNIFRRFSKPEEKIQAEYKIQNKQPNKANIDWDNLTKNCQHSFINILESGYFLNNGEKSGLIFLLDFNTNSVRFYEKKNGIEKELDKATIDEIMDFEEMPTMTLTEIVNEMKERYNVYNDKFQKVNDEIEKIQVIIEKARAMGGEENIIQKAKTLLDSMIWEHKKLEMEYRFFYHRLNALNLIDHSK